MRILLFVLFLVALVFGTDKPSQADDCPQIDKEVLGEVQLIKGTSSCAGAESLASVVRKIRRFAPVLPKEPPAISMWVREFATYNPVTNVITIFDITNPYFENIVRNQLSRNQYFEQVVGPNFAHEYAHTIFYQMIGDEENSSELDAFNEFFADLVAVLFSNNPQAMSKALELSGDDRAAALARDFSHKQSVPTDPYIRHEYTALSPTRHFLWSNYLSQYWPLTNPAKRLLLEQTIKAIRLTIDTVDTLQLDGVKDAEKINPIFQSNLIRTLSKSH